MNNFSFKHIVLFVIIIIEGSYIIGQSSKEGLIDQREKLLNEIAFTNKLIELTKKKKGNTIESVRLIDKKIANRNKLILNYREEINIIEHKIIDREKTVSNLREELKNQKDLYAEFIRYSYKNYNHYSTAVYLLASNSLNQFYLRKKYLEQLKEARVKKIKLIISIENRINLEISELDKNKIELSNTILEIKGENAMLQGEKTKRQGIVKSLTDEEKDLKKQLVDKKRIEEEIAKRLAELIREEAKKSKFAKLTPEQQLISNDFASNKGKLPWPTGQGVITEKFGEHWHPVIKGVKVRNSGIDITTISYTNVRTVFNGEVSKIFAIKGANYTVIIRHGKFYSVYHNLANLKVNIGDQVSTKDIIGNVGSSNTSDNFIVHFEIWNGLEKMNPEDWISN